MAARRPIRIAGKCDFITTIYACSLLEGCSGAATDRRDAMRALAANCANDQIDVIMGDWMSEANMTSRGASKFDQTAPTFTPQNTQAPGQAAAVPAYEPTFLEALEPALPHIAKHGIKVAVNAGASDTEALHKVVMKMVKDKGLDLKCAWISGDEVLPAIKKARSERKTTFENICTGEILDDWRFEPIYAQAYLGGLGIAAAFAKGADIVVCGRVSDASPVIGAAYWWHNWSRSDLSQLANAFVAGHLIECSNYVCGGNFTGFKSLQSKNWHDIGYPIAEIASSGQIIITKNQGSGGEVSTQTCSSQLLYEIQGPWYFNSDVTAILSNISFEQLSTNRVALHGVTAAPPPPTTKVGLTARGGYQAELHWFLCGLDIPEKAQMMEAQIRHLLHPHMSRFSKLEFTINGSAAVDASNQNAATVDFRVFAQAKDEESLMPKYFFRPCVDPIMQGYPGATPHLDWRTALPKPIFEYWVTLMPQAEVRHKVHLWNGEVVDVAPPEVTRNYEKQQPDQPVTEELVGEMDWGETVRGPLGWIVHARSGDKGSNANVGFWVRHKDEWDWLRTLLSTETIKRLLADEYNGKKIVSRGVIRLRLRC